MSEQRTVLLVSYHFPPRGERSAVRSVNIARTLAAMGWKVVVLCCMPDGTTVRDDDWSATLEGEGIHIYTTPSNRTPVPLRDGLIHVPSPAMQSFRQWVLQWKRQPDVHIAWEREAYTMAKRIMSEHYVNVVLASAPPFSTYVIARRIASDYGIPFAIDVAGEWLENPALMYPTPMHRSSVVALEEALVKQAGIVFATNRLKKEDMLRRHRFLTHEEIVIAPHGFYDDDVTNRGIHDTSHCTITHYADFTNGLTPKYMLKALRLLFTKRADIRSQLIVNIVGLARQQHRKLSKKYGLNDCVRFFDTVNRRTALSVCAESNVLWLAAEHDAPASNALMGEYLGFAKPIFLTSPSGTLLNTAKESNAVFHAGYTDVKAIAQQVENIFDAWKSSQLPRANQQHLDTLSYKTIGKDISRSLGMIMRL
ncbi:MAG: hypothetical protein JNL32_07215 [Candidatus Kapabacteria bacterium]|nr:hypothetical protein [Candidatus Kapabacteria bacterium]